MWLFFTASIIYLSAGATFASGPVSERGYSPEVLTLVIIAGFFLLGFFLTLRSTLGELHRQISDLNVKNDLLNDQLRGPNKEHARQIVRLADELKGDVNKTLRNVHRMLTTLETNHSLEAINSIRRLVLEYQNKAFSLDEITKARRLLEDD